MRQNYIAATRFTEPEERSLPATSAFMRTYLIPASTRWLGTYGATKWAPGALKTFDCMIGTRRLDRSKADAYLCLSEVADIIKCSEPYAYQLAAKNRIPTW
jgi:hypothetical protein